jgi:lysozyme
MRPETLRTSRLGLHLKAHFEGCRLRSYRCPAGVWTIGYGHTSGAGGVVNLADGRRVYQIGANMEITQEEADRLFWADTDMFEDGVEKILGMPGHLLTTPQFDALVSLAFNIGLTAFRKSTVCKRVLAGELDRVPEAMLWWNKARDRTGTLVEMKGLTRRRRAEAALFRNDLEEAERYLGVPFPAEEMAQEVEAPTPPKGMEESKTGWAAVVAILVTVVQALSPIFSDVKDLLTHPVSAGALTALALAALVFIWFDRRHKLRVDRV